MLAISNFYRELVCCSPRPAFGQSREVGCVGARGFFVMPTALPVLAALDEDAGEQGFAGLKSGSGILPLFV